MSKQPNCIPSVESVADSTVKGAYSRPALAAWESMFRATTTLARAFEEGDAWGELSQPEYGVLLALYRQPKGVRICELGSDVLLTQTGLSRLVTRLADKGLVERKADPEDGRATLLVLTDSGRETQKRIGRKHARDITDAMAKKLDEEQLRQLQSLCSALLES